MDFLTEYYIVLYENLEMHKKRKLKPKVRSRNFLSENFIMLEKSWENAAFFKRKTNFIFRDWWWFRLDVDFTLRMLNNFFLLISGFLPIIFLNNYFICFGFEMKRFQSQSSVTTEIRTTTAETAVARMVGSQVL